MKRLRHWFADWLETVADRVRPSLPTLTMEQATTLMREHNRALSQVMAWSTREEISRVMPDRSQS